MPRYTEDSLVQRTTADYFRDALGWESVFAFDEETFGADGTLGRESKREIVLTRYLRQSLEKLNPNLPAVAYDAAINKILEASVSKDILQINREKYALHRDGVLVEFKNDKGDLEKTRLRLFDFEQAENNHFLVVRELWIKGATYNRRADIIGYVNGLPLLFIELKQIHKDLRYAFDQNFTDYKDTVPHIFHHNAFVVLGNGDKGLIGSLSSRFEHFHEWKRLDEEANDAVEFQTLLDGVCSKQNFMDLFENFILFDETKSKLAKIVARNHQFLGVNLAVEAVRNRRNLDGKLGVFWHTQGSGKSYSMVFFAEKVRRKVEGDFTFLIVTDRDDLDTQIYKTFAGCGIVDNKTDNSRAASGDNLREILTANKPYIFSMIQKFNKRVADGEAYTRRADVIVISDEAHRTQYGLLAQNMRDALPNASYIGFTGTPLFADDEITKRIFGGYVSTYNFQRAVKDNATVPLYYDNRGEKLKIETTDINEKIAAKIEAAELNEEETAAVKRALGKDYDVFTTKTRLEAIAADFVEHYTTRWESGKAMLVCLDKITTVRMLDFIRPVWQSKIEETRRAIAKSVDEQEEAFLRRKIEWLESTELAVIISEEQNEVQKFKTWDIDIESHRKLIKNGFVGADGKQIDVDEAFKKPEHPFRVAIVCAMWLTGFDVPSLATLYLDKPLKAHTLMQTIARANRVYEGKNNGLIVDYCGILKELRKALATFAASSTTEEKTAEEVIDLKPEENLLSVLDEAINETKSFLIERGFRLEDVSEKESFAKIAAINQAKEAINHSEETRKKFNILAREVNRKYKACLNQPLTKNRREAFYSIDIIEKRLKDDHKKADISQILKEMHDIVNESVKINPDEPGEQNNIYDISNIDFERLKNEFQKSVKKNTTVQALKNIVEKRLDTLMRKNPRRTNFLEKYLQIINGYNEEKDRLTIELTFEALLHFVAELDGEEKRAMREGLDEESLALFDLLLKENLSTHERNRLKQIAKELLNRLKIEKLNITNWDKTETNKANVQSFIYNYLYDEKSGLPDSYTQTEIKEKSGQVFSYIYQHYSNINQSVSP